jgi:hypothetical protein
MVLRSTQASPEAAISKSSLPTCWPLIVMRNLPLSGAKTDGAFAGVGALDGDAALTRAAKFGSDRSVKPRRLKPAPLDAAPLAAIVASDNANANAKI